MLRLSHDRKVTNSVSPNGKSSKVANAFGLPSGRDFSCPGQTSVCESVCYAGKLEKIYSGVRALLLSNWEQLQGKTTTEMADMISVMLDGFRAESVKRGASLDFRIHWDGDFFSHSYTQAWAVAIARNPDIRFWVYTRSFAFVPALRDLDNLTTYLSVDSDNIKAAYECRKANPFVRWAYLDRTFAEGREALAEFPAQKTYNCPENDRRIPLISVKGSACIRCNVCVTGRGDVLFSASKR